MTFARSALPAPLASIDIGSNSLRLEIAELQRGNYRRLAYLKETVRLGAGLDADGRLTETAIQRGLDCLGRFAETLRGFAPAQVRAVATQTLREATNRQAFLQRAEAVLGHPVEVISGREEARLIFAGVARLQPSEATRLVIDIGGRSTEMILGQGRTPLRAESFQVGSVGLSLRFFPDGRFTPASFRAAQVAAGAEFEEALSQFAKTRAEPRWIEALGSSGTVGAVSQILSASGVTDGSITAPGLRWCIEQCLASGHVDALALPGLKEDRRAVVGGGLCILYTLLTQFGIERLQTARGALRQGVIFDLVERRDAAAGRAGHDLREQSVGELQTRFNVDRSQASHVQNLTLRLHKQLQPDAPDELRRELGWAAALHEIGMMVSHHEHHRHSAYLLAHIDAPGFSENQLRRLGDLALGQRGGLRKLEGRLSEDETLVWQLLALRLAVAQCHARTSVDPAALQLERNGRHVRIVPTAGWAERQPRALYLLREELQAWARLGVINVEL